MNPLTVRFILVYAGWQPISANTGYASVKHVSYLRQAAAREVSVHDPQAIVYLAQLYVLSNRTAGYR